MFGLAIELNWMYWIENFMLGYVAVDFNWAFRLTFGRSGGILSLWDGSKGNHRHSFPGNEFLRFLVE